MLYCRIFVSEEGVSWQMTVHSVTSGGQRAEMLVVCSGLGGFFGGGSVRTESG